MDFEFDDRADTQFSEAVTAEAPVEMTRRWSKGQFNDDDDEDEESESEKDKVEENKSDDSDFELLDGFGLAPRRAAQQEQKKFQFPAPIFPYQVKIGETSGHKSRLDQILEQLNLK